jgi:predicted nucleotidyltransferase
MNIDAKQRYAGVPILTVRDTVRQLAGSVFDVLVLARALHAKPGPMKKVIAKLVADGYAKATDERGHWTITSDGVRFGNASAAKPLHRSAANRVLLGLLHRAKDVNTSERFMYRVKTILLFGSYLTEKERLGDVDVLVEIKDRRDDYPSFDAYHEASTRHAKKSGREFGSWFEEYQWPYREVLLYLKKRSRSIALHPFETHEKWIEDKPYKTIFVNYKPDARFLKQLEAKVPIAERREKPRSMKRIYKLEAFVTVTDAQARRIAQLAKQQMTSEPEGFQDAVVECVVSGIENAAGGNITLQQVSVGPGVHAPRRFQPDLDRYYRQMLRRE